MSELTPGLHEDIVTSAIDAYLDEIDTEFVERRAVDSAEVADRIALHLARLIERSVDAVGEARRLANALEVAQRVVALLAGEPLEAEVLDESPVADKKGRPELLAAIHGRNPDGTPRRLASPQIPLLDTTLLTNAPGEPRVGHQISSEINSADSVDVVMAFIRTSGINPLLDALSAHCESGRALRVLTTTYTNSTQLRALERLAGLGAQVRVSYDTTGTRLHAKAWLFHRNSGHSTAYVGSSNLTHQAQQTGLEWNVRLAEARNRPVIEKISGVFDSYWESGDFEPFDPGEFTARTATESSGGEVLVLPPTEIHLEPFQERLLEQIEVSRERGRHANLLASATGTGKTVMAAVDYARLAQRLQRSRLVFVAHRGEILRQARDTYRHALRDASFGELWVGGERPSRWDHVFASVQSLTATGIEELDPRHFDVVVIDEFHHAAAPTYTALLERLEPVELLGLTATPERSDGLPVLDWFDGRIAAELRLWDAIDQHRLSPFEYYGIHDGVDLTSVRWVRGRGYDVDGLTNVLTADDAIARRIAAAVGRHVDDPKEMSALGFCVSVEHARFMARQFNAAGIPSVAVWADTPATERREALTDLAARRVNVVFSVDLFNEGIDVPVVDTLLMLRPTDSPTLFLQQLGRGLRRSPGKAACLVLDFIGLHRNEYRLDRRYRALLGGTRKALSEAVEEGFPYLPVGCHMELDAVSRNEVVRSVRESVRSVWAKKVDELRALVASGRPVTMAGYLAETGLELEDIYAGDHCWTELQEAAGLDVAAPGPEQSALRRAVGRLLHVNDTERLEFAQQVLAGDMPDLGSMSARQQRLLRMLAVSLADQALGKTAKESVDLYAALRIVWSHPAVLAEVCELFSLMEERQDHVHPDTGLPAEVPLAVHGRYTRIEIQ